MRMILAALLIASALLAACVGSTPSVPAESVQATLDSFATQSAEESAGQPAGATSEQPGLVATVPPDQPLAEEPTVEVSAVGVPPTAPATEPSAEEPPPVIITPLNPVAGTIAYSLPPALLNADTGLYVSPNRDDLVAQVIIPAGSTIYLMGRNATSSHLRAVWNTGVGWVPVSFTSYSGDREALEKLPVFEQEPPRCAVPVTTQFNLGSMWASDQRMRVVVVVDLFRSRYGDFPPSYLLLTVNGTAVESSRRPIVERGQFSLKDIVFSLPNYLQPGDTLSYQLETASTEDLAFMATIFQVPDGCVWDVD